MQVSRFCSKICFKFRSYHLKKNQNRGASPTPDERETTAFPFSISLAAPTKCFSSCYRANLLPPQTRHPWLNWGYVGVLPPSRKLAQRIRTLPTETIVPAGSFVIARLKNLLKDCILNLNWGNRENRVSLAMAYWNWVYVNEVLNWWLQNLLAALVS